MATERKSFGKIDNSEISLFTIRNAAGASLAVTDFGATAR